MRFAYPFTIAFVLHVLVCSLVVIQFRGPVYVPPMEFYFWGGILRKDDLFTGKSDALQHTRGGVSFGEIIDRAVMNWRNGLAPDKPEKKAARSLRRDPEKFTGPKVLPDESVGQEGVVDWMSMPQAQPVKLRYPRP